MIGSTELPLIWSERTTPQGRSIYRLAPWTPRISGSGSIGVGSPWATPTTRDHKDTGDLSGSMTRKDGKSRLDVLPRQVFAMWATPLVNDELGSQYCYGKIQPDGTRKKFWKLPGQVIRHTTWPTPKASDGDGGRTSKTKGGGNSHLPIHAREASGQAPSCEAGRTAKLGGLNPAFPCWLQGWPDAFTHCVLRATASFRRSRQK